MKLLLDTCTVLWAGLAPDRLSGHARGALERADAEIAIASITAAEIACAQARERVRLDRHWKLWLRDALDVNGWDVLPATLEVVEEAYCLPEPFHADPADRIIAATARLERRTLVTGDRLLLAYAHVDTLW